MAIETPCQTPDAWFTCEVTTTRVSVMVQLPFSLDLSREDAIALEHNMHNAMELVLAPYFVGR